MTDLQGAVGLVQLKNWIGLSTSALDGRHFIAANLRSSNGSISRPSPITAATLGRLSLPTCGRTGRRNRAIGLWICCKIAALPRGRERTRFTCLAIIAVDLARSRATFRLRVIAAANRWPYRCTIG